MHLFRISLISRVRDLQFTVSKSFAFIPKYLFFIEERVVGGVTVYGNIQKYLF
jgi:hypothetical protein